MHPSEQEWAKLLEWAQQLLELPVSQQAAFADALQLSPSLRLELDTLVEAKRLSDAHRFLDQLPRLDGTTPASVRPDAQIGTWRVMRKLGEGGMSSVWLAERMDGHLRRNVALKFPRVDLGQDLLIRRLRRERDILAALEHPHIARLYDVGMTPEGVPYLVMEYVQGQALIAHANAHRLDIAARLVLFGQVLSAVQYAHANLVLHNDVKPNNILVGASARIKLLDFGIAGLIAPSEAPNQASGDTTLLSAHLMTPSYASPEQLRGERLGVASDIYSLGMVLHELLTGQSPRQRATPGSLAADPAEDIPGLPSRLRFSTQDLAARSASRTALARQLKGDLDAIMLKALTLRPEHRYASCERFAHDLTAYLGGQPVSARAPALSYYMGKAIRRHRWAVGISMLLLAALLTTAAIALRQYRAAEAQGQRAAAARDFLLDLFADSAPDRRAGAQVTAAQLLEEGRQRALTRLSGQGPLQAEVLAGLGQTQFQMGDLPHADASLKAAAELFHALGDARGEAHARLLRVEVAHDDDRTADFMTRIREVEPLGAAIHQSPALELQWALMKAFEMNATSLQPAAQATLAATVSRVAAALPANDAVLWRVTRTLVVLSASSGDAAQVTYWSARARALSDVDDPADRVIRALELASAQAEAGLYLSRFKAVQQQVPGDIAQCEHALGGASRICTDLGKSLLWAMLRSGDWQPALAHMPALQPALLQSSARRQQFHAAYLLARILAVNGKLDWSQAPLAALERMADPEAAEPLNPRLRLAALYTLVELGVRSGDMDRARRWLDIAEALAHSAPPDTLGVERKRLGLARGLYLQAQGQHQQAIRSMGGFCDGHPIGVVATWVSVNCADSFLALGDRPQAERILEAALTEAIRLLGEDAPNVARIRQRLHEAQGSGAMPPAWRRERIFMS